MSLHSQLLRGLLAMPLMLLLAIAGAIAPDAGPAAAGLPPAMDAPAPAGSMVPGARTHVVRACPHATTAVVVVRR